MHLTWNILKEKWDLGPRYLDHHQDHGPRVFGSLLNKIGLLRKFAKILSLVALGF